ncbi:hypothetical protein, variant 3 [Aphanomyces astaci]|uniref:CUE domain-containing protein n=1 Tax=Aphanomyces astaci TaxID=112090 RepID=W4FBT6_APHAT|nr:hypothetical protein, variant 2 [Aphanomyces astaci]XP_009846350.1 hypothetical protein, variant 3 [Aphanomyces astaci]ETV64162.1 hypothetical protein, variant 2 [Aphanomyces astaci]ETV64163.1 hypothetical protein, variant 3 [Aphanomyces astaci]|eukprot:XP_009846349.1 hypothetical protein, variant 2 [Aphanomyces astaci]
MDVLAQIFPDIPEGILAEVLHNCGGCVEAASDWLCEHDWHELVPDNDDDETNQQEDGEGLQHGDNSYTNANLLTISTPVALEAPPAASAMPPLGPFDNPSDDEGDEDDEDEDDEDDEDDDNMYYDSGDDGDGGRLGGGPRVPPLTSRTKISPSSDAAGISSPGNEPRFWVAFDDVTMQKSMIELLNMSPTKLAHHRIAILSTPSLDKASADAILLRVPSSPPQQLHMSTTLSKGTSVKRSHATMQGGDALGYFAHFFAVNDLDMLWRSILHGHLLNRRFGTLLDFRSTSVTKARDFDELMNIAAHGGRRHPPSMMRRQHLDRVADLTCGLATPCTAADMLRVGTNLHGVLSLATGSSLYFRAAASIPPPFVASGMGLMEVSFRAGATHRIRRLESAPPETGPSAGLGYQPPKKIEYILQSLDDLSGDENGNDDHA